MPPVELTVNGQRQRLEVEPEETLLAALRDRLGLTGAKYGCGEGQCGACTVILDGRRVRSCVTKVAAADGKPVRTIEGVADGDKLHPLQEAFLEAGALQCGYCTPGMILSALALLEENPNPTRDEIARGMNGTICRCGAYQRIVAAVETAAKVMKGGAK
jgi:nicotinate dehydrogenase subunit A